MEDRTNIDDSCRPRIRGRPFAKGNAGRPPGSRNRATLVAEALFDGEGQELMRKGLELAKSGDSPMLRFFLERVIAKDRPVHINLVPDDDFDPVEASGKVIDAVAEGQITPSEGLVLTNILEARARITRLLEFGERLEEIEKELRRLRKPAP